MKKIVTPLCIIACVIIIAFCVVVEVERANKGEPQRFGQFVVIKLDAYDGDSYMGFETTFRQYTVYNENTKVVYLYTVYRNGIAITPYIMRNVFGEMTVGVYNTETHEIAPMEPYMDEYGEEWVIAG